MMMSCACDAPPSLRTSHLPHISRAGFPYTCGEAAADNNNYFYLPGGAGSHSVAKWSLEVFVGTPCPYQRMHSTARGLGLASRSALSALLHRVVMTSVQN